MNKYMNCPIINRELARDKTLAYRFDNILKRKVVTMNEVLKNLLLFAIPFIKELIESKVVPTLKRKAYERLDDFTNDRIEDLAVLVDKINATNDPIKKKAHIEGLKLGVATLKAIAEKITLACVEFDKILK